MARRNRRGTRSGKGNRSAQPRQVHPNAAAAGPARRRWTINSARNGATRRGVSTSWPASVDASHTRRVWITSMKCSCRRQGEGLARIEVEMQRRSAHLAALSLVIIADGAS